MSRAEVREVDRRAIQEFGLAGIVLMENAGRGCAEWILELGVSGPVIVCCGKGNNGGDGFVLARHLTNRNCEVRVLLFCRPNDLQGDAAANFRVIAAAGLTIWSAAGDLNVQQLDRELSGAQWIVDALLGTGTQGSLREPYPTVIEAINRSSARVFAVDLPSGLDCDRGEPVDPTRPVCVRADFTATFVTRKLGFDAPASRQYTGEVRVIDIGVPHSMFDRA